MVYTDSTSTRQWLDNTKTRNAIDRLMGLGCSLIKIEKNRLIVEWNKLKESSAFGMLKTDLIEAALKQMVEMGHILEARSESRTYSDVQAGTDRRAFVLAIFFPFIILVGSAICYLFAESYYYPFSWQSITRGAIPYSLVLLIFQLVISISLLRTISAHRYILIAVIIISSIAYPLGGTSLTAVINGARDHSSGIWHNVKVTGKHKLGHKDFTLKYYRLKVVLPENGKEVEIPVSGNLFRSLQAQRNNIRILIKPGYLGYPWLAGTEKSGSLTRSGYSLRSAWDLQQSGQKFAALQQFSGYISARSGDAKGYYYRGRLYAEMKHYSDSLAIFGGPLNLIPIILMHIVS